MTMELRPGRFVSRMFYTELSAKGPGPGNIAAYLFRDNGEDFWRIHLRFRFYVDDDRTAKSNDRKVTQEFRAPPEHSLAQIVSTIKIMFDVAGGGAFEEIIIDSDDPVVVMNRVKEQPWANACGPLTQEQYDALQRE